MGKGGGSKTTKKEIPKWLENTSKKNIEWGGRLMDNPYQTYGGQQVAGLSPDQNRANRQTRWQSGTRYHNANRQKVRDTVRDVDVGNVYAQSAGDGQGYGGMVRDVTTKAWADPAVREAYMNPYEDQVVGNVQKDMSRQAQIERNRLAGQAQQQGAWGGSGGGLAQSEFDRNYVDRMSSTVGNLRHQGYGQAAGIFGQDMNRALQAGMANQGADNQAAGRQLSADQSNQSAYLRAQQSNQSAHMQEQLANQAADQASYGLWDQEFENRSQATERLRNQGAGQQQLRQLMLDTDRKDWNQLQQAPYERANWLAGIMSGTPYSQTTTTPDSGPGAGQQILGAATTLGAAALMSDRRVKRNVQRVGTTPEGLGLYSYRYLWSDKDEIGVMADEVRRVRPDAVATGALTGLDSVDYSKLEVAA